MKKYDVVVVGGGFAGVSAAIAAAREGSSVLLVEKGNALGGMAVNALVIPFMPNATRIDGELTELSQGRTTLVVAHRLSTVKSADEILVLERGDITERGTHDQLLQSGGLYAQLYRYQFKE